jgi:acyl-CoA dehydrogenase
MDFAFSEEHRLIADTARRIGERFGPDYWLVRDKAKAFPREMWQEICDAGLCGIALPEALGGGGLGMVELALVIENLTAGGAGATLAQVFMLNPVFGGVSLSKFAPPAMRDALMPGLINGEIGFCMALTEPDAGSNSLEIRTFARRTGEGWRLDGQKIWITGVDVAQKMLVVCRTKRIEDCARKSDGLSLFMIDTNRAGLSWTPIEKAGTNTLISATVHFDGVEVRADELIGGLDDGWRALLDILNTERIVTTAGLAGAGRFALSRAVAYAAGRQVFGGRPIGSYQGLQFPLAQAHAEIEAASLMNYKAAWLFDTGRPFGSEANAAKLLGYRAANAAIEQAMQTMGGMGYARESHLERLWRDVRLFRFAPVSEEMLLNFIAQHDLKMPRSY